MWKVTVEDVLSRWVGTEPPEEDDVVLGTLTEDAIVLIDSQVRDIDDRIPTQSNLMSLLKIVVSKVVQRAYSSDYSVYTAQSQGYGPFSESYSKSDGSKQGLFLNADELSMISSPSDGDTRIRVIRNRARPNFCVQGW